MNTPKVLALSLAAALLSAPFAMSANAATTTTAHPRVAARHHAVKPVRSTPRANARAAASADHSADSLNAQSLARSRGAQ